MIDGIRPTADAADVPVGRRLVAFSKRSGPYFLKGRSRVFFFSNFIISVVLFEYLRILAIDRVKTKIVEKSHHRKYIYYYLVISRTSDTEGDQIAHCLLIVPVLAILSATSPIRFLLTIFRLVMTLLLYYYFVFFFRLMTLRTISYSNQ